MIRRVSILLLVVALLSLVGCATFSQTLDNARKDTNMLTEKQTDMPSVVIKASPDKYTWYIKNYVGMNCASIGYTSMGGERFDKYGRGLVELIFVTLDGTYVDIGSIDDLKQYVVTGQSIEPNTELKYTYRKDSSGDEYDNLIATQSHREMVLSVKRIGDRSRETIDLTTIEPSPDKYTWYIKNYVGMNCASIGYTSMGGDRFDEYGSGLVELIFVTLDGTYVDIGSIDDLKQYVVTGQSIEPNTELKFTYQKDSSGDEYDNLIATQSHREIVLSAKKIGDRSQETVDLTTIKPSPDKYTWYIKNYVGMNSASIGYTSMGGDRFDEYGRGHIKLIFITSDGTYVDIGSIDDLKQYVVTGQNIEPNTELKFTYQKNSSGDEYDNLIATQNYDEIVIYLKRVGD